MDGHISSDEENDNPNIPLHRLRGINLADEMVYETLHRLFEAAALLLLPNIGDATERVVALFSKLYKLQARLTKVKP